MVLFLGGITYLNNNRLREFCHAPREALQKIRAANNRLEIPTDLYPYINGMDSSEDPNRLVRANFSKTDLFIIEISSVRRLTLNGYELQLNFVTDHLVKPYNLDNWLADISRKARQAGEGVKVKSDRNLENAPEEVAKILSEIEMTLETDRSIRDIVHKISNYLHRPILFVGHFNVDKEDGSKVADRNRLNQCLKKTALECNEFYCEPLEIIEKYTPEIALRDNNHWNYNFELTAGKSMYINHIKPLLLNSRGNS